MKKITCVLFLAMFISLAFAQKDTVKLREINNTLAIVTDRAPQALYFQLLGSSPIISINYDKRFGKRVNGAGFSVGLGFWGISGLSIFSVPISLNYLFGKNTHFLEASGGGTFVTANTSLFESGNNGSAILYHISVGYRYQPTRGGFFFRGGYTQLFGVGETIPWFYLGFGHNF